MFHLQKKNVIVRKFFEFYFMIYTVYTIHITYSELLNVHVNKKRFNLYL